MALFTDAPLPLDGVTSWRNEDIQMEFGMLRFSGLFAVLLLLSASADGADPGGGVFGQGAASAEHILIRPMTSVDRATHEGYFQDPHPIYLYGLSQFPRLPPFSGTTQKLMACGGPIRPECFRLAGLTFDAGPIAQAAAQDGSVIHDFENLNIFQGHHGGWHMAVVAHLEKAGKHPWNVILHAHPTDAAPFGVPRAWVADKVLVGDLGEPANDHYDSKYVEDGNALYLIYNTQLGKGLDGIVAQAMVSPTQAAGTAPVVLLGPATRDGGFRSEIAYGLNQPSDVRLVEAANVTRIHGKYVLTYSVGTFDRPDYKIGVAYSDTFLPKPGSSYRRVLMADPGDVWGGRRHREVLYLLQSQLPQWPHFVGKQVTAPGVGSIIRDDTGGYDLAFAGYDPSDRPLNQQTGRYNGSFRRPYYIPLEVRIPSWASVAHASDRELQDWIRPVPSCE